MADLSIHEILRAIKKKHVRRAIAYIDGHGVPKGRNSTRYSVRGRKGALYPPKYVVCVAAFYATGRTLKPDEHSGGRQSNDVLTGLKFRIIQHPSNLPEES